MGFLTYLIIASIYFAESVNVCTSTINDVLCLLDLDQRFKIFFPFGVYKNGFLNILFWILVGFIILSLVRYFRKKKSQTTPKQN